MPTYLGCKYLHASHTLVFGWAEDTVAMTSRYHNAFWTPAHFSHPDTELGSRVREDSKKFSSNSQIQDSGSQSMQKVNTNKSGTTPKSQAINRTIKTSENGKKTHLRYGTKLFLPVSNK